MDTLQVQRDAARKAHKLGDNATQKLLENLFGKEHFVLDFKERFATFEDICREAGVNPRNYQLPASASDDAIGDNANNMLKLIFKTINEAKGWKANYADGKQEKWTPYFQYVAGSGFRFYGSDFDLTLTFVGGRLSTYDRETSDFIGKNFIDIWNKYLIVP